MFKYVYSLAIKNLIEKLLFFKFSVNVNFLQWPFNRHLRLLVFGKNIAKRLCVLMIEV